MDIFFSIVSIDYYGLGIKTTPSVSFCSIDASTSSLRSFIFHDSSLLQKLYLDHILFLLITMRLPNLGSDVSMGKFWFRPD